MNPKFTNFLIFIMLSTMQATLALPAHHPRSSAGGVVIVPPPDLGNQTGIAQIPDAAHPFQAPGLNDQRGPCPGLNTLANHGYLPRNGIASFKQIINATREGFNMGYDLSSALASFAMLARGNAFLDQLSIGGPSPHVPPLPGQIDGPVAGGIATHGRFEGDVSMTRQDAAIGDNKDFQADLYDELLLTVGQFGDDSPVTGNRSVVNIQTMGEFKFRRFVEDQKADKQLEYHVGRFSLSYGEASFPLIFFANGTDGVLSVESMSTFFRNQTFPANWFRRGTPAGFQVVGNFSDAVLALHPEVLPGANDKQGVYVADNVTDPCALYDNLASENLPAVLVNTTGVLKKNVDTLLQQILTPFTNQPGGSCSFNPPRGPAGV